ncbi:MAG TPA: hypothetical protein VLT16_07165 [Candidatus Limnocylindrales bacterium]|nr:hypothetical protein [Candidatus Limnocylindrales bacterium]
MPSTHAERASRVLGELLKYETALREWIGRCTVNAIWYRCDPIGAIREADLGIDEELLCELEALHAEEAYRDMLPALLAKGAA